MGLVGLYKYSPSGYGGKGLRDALAWEVVLLVVLLVHRHVLRRRGHWDSERTVESEGATVPVKGVAGDATVTDESVSLR